MLINRIDDQTISGKIGKSIFEEMYAELEAGLNSRDQTKSLNLKD